MSDEIELPAVVTAEMYSGGSVVLAIFLGTLWAAVGGQIGTILVLTLLPVLLLVLAVRELLYTVPREYGEARSYRLKRETARLRNAREDRELQDAAQERAKLASVAFGGSPQSYLDPSPFFAERIRHLQEDVAQAEAMKQEYQSYGNLRGIPKQLPAGKTSWLDVPIPQSMLPQPNPPYYIHDLMPPGPVVWKYNAGEGRRKYEPCICRHAHLLPAGATCLYCGGLSQRETK